MPASFGNESPVDRATFGETEISYSPFSKSHPTPRTMAIIVVCTLLVAANGLAWIWALAEFAGQRTLLGAALLAYTFGLRHAIDGDHIAAIDQATRRAPRTPEGVMVGSLFFAMGHSMVVVAGMVSVAAATIALDKRFQQFEALSGCVAAGASTMVLLGIAIVNLAIFVHVWRRFRQTYRRGTCNRPQIRASCQSQLPIYRHLQIFHTDPLRFIFRLGLGGVTEVVVLGILSAQAAARGSTLSWLVLPTLFTVALVLIDLTDGMPISYACTRVLADPLRRSWFCLAVTVVSALVAFFIFFDGTIGIVPEIVQRYGRPWPAIGEFNHWLVAVDYVALCFFVLSLAISAQVCRTEYRYESG